ncbi:MAG TPA: DUF4349 domain-containing protein, partial [Gemmataceae bacterium]|nr:DUF4349 domain-containing protein [Gemmataceae bacterium]
MAETDRKPRGDAERDEGKPKDAPVANGTAWGRTWFTDQPPQVTKERTHGGIDGTKQLYTYRNDAPKPSQVLAISPDGKPAFGEYPSGEKAGKANKLLTDATHFRPPDSGVEAGDVAQQEQGKEGQKALQQQGQGRGESKSESNARVMDHGSLSSEFIYDIVPAKPREPVPAQRKIIRSGDIEFEIESFDSAVATVTKLINAIKGGFIATVNSDRLPNGKVRGSVVVRVPPEALDSFVLDLRKELGKGGELKSLKIGSQDITKQYTDLEGKLKAARTMEERLLKIIKEGKGEIKDLLNAEKELGVWRTKIEEFEGEIRYYANQVALSTLTITLYEKEIRAPYAIVETERISMGVEVEDVEKAQQQLLTAVGDAKGRITKSELKQQSAGQYQATIHFEVAPEAAGPLRDRLRQLGTVARLDIGRLQQTEGGSGDPRTAKSKRQDTQFFVDLYNVATIAPHETVQIHLACVDTEAVFRAILSRVRGASGRVVTSNLNRQKDEQTTAAINCEVKTTEAEALLDELKKSGDVLHFQITENPDMQHATRSRRGFIIQLYAFGTVQPRETQMLQVASRDVPTGYRALLDAVTKAKGRVLNAQLNEQDKQNIFAQLDFDIRRADEAAVEEVLAKLGDVYSRTATRAQDSENVLDTKLQMKVMIKNVTSIPARRTVNLALEVGNVEETVASMTARVTDAQGRTVGSNISHERTGR